MRLNEKEIENIICNSVTENLICRALELRPGELAKFICGLANVNGGYILVGVESNNIHYPLISFVSPSQL